jgi:dipeptidyl aminopeptidase/acylaminoacyl peptidase
MLSNKKTKKVLISIIIAFIIFAIISFSATVLIYNSTFPRYDCNITAFSDELQQIVDSRQDFNYKSGKNTLSGFLYNSTTANKKDTLVILAPGHNACADSYLWQIKELLNYGWSVFAFDTTGSCHSEGKSNVGFSQEILDLKATLEYINSQKNLGYGNIALLGHSRGGYAVCCSLAFDYDISAVISVSGVNSAMDAIMGASSQYVGKIAFLNYPFLWGYQAMLFGADTVNLKANEILAESTTPTLLIHGADDTTYPTDKYSIVSQIKDEKIEVLIRRSPDNSGHTNLLFSKDGTADDEIIEKINEFLLENTK